MSYVRVLNTGPSNDYERGYAPALLEETGETSYLPPPDGLEIIPAAESFYVRSGAKPATEGTEAE